MRKICLCFAAFICLFCGCSSNSASNNSSNHSSNNPSDNPSDDPPGNIPNPTGEVQVANDSKITLYYDIPQTIKVDLKEGHADLKVESNNCINILTDSLVTDANGIATLDIQARLFNCENGKKVKVCVDDIVAEFKNEENCVEFIVRTTSNDDEIDANHNLMFDIYETNKDKDKFANYDPKDCESFCHDDGDCEDFCDSAIGFRCSTRCTSDDQCIKYQDDDDNWVQMVCREDGRCAYPSFVAVYNIGEANTTVTMGGKPMNDHVTIDWGDGTDIETIPTSTDSNLSHTYAKKGQYYVEIKGDYRDWTAGCKYTLGDSYTPIVALYDVLQFGSIGLGYSEKLKQGSFWNCYELNRMSAKDIPISTKLTDMTKMFGAAAEGMLFNDPAITRWDTSNVTSMQDTFVNGGRTNGHTNGIKSDGFNQNIGRWNTSKVTTMNSMFFNAVIFNQPIGCWNTSNVEDISKMFTFTQTFNQYLGDWDLSKVTQHDCVFRYENGKVGKISLKNYCALRSRVNNENIGRDGDRSDTVYGDCPDLYNELKNNLTECEYEDKQKCAYHSTCCGNSFLDKVPSDKHDMYLCRAGYNYGTACDGFTAKGEYHNWKTIVDTCWNEYFQYQDKGIAYHEPYNELTEDTITCWHLRQCTFAYYWCKICHDEPEKHEECSIKCADYPNNRSKSCKNGGMAQCPTGKDTFCNEHEIFDPYLDNTYSCDRNVHVCHPCQHLDWDD